MLENNQLILALLLQLLILFLAVLTDPYIRRQQKRMLYQITVLAFSLVLVEGILPFLKEDSQAALKGLADTYSLCIQPIVLLLFLRVVNAGKSRKWHWYLVFLNVLFHIAVFIGNKVLSIDFGFFWNGMSKWFGVAAVFLLLFCLSRETIRKVRHMRSTEAIIPILNIILLPAAAAADLLLINNSSYRFMTIAFISCSLLYYIWLHLQFEQEHEQALVAEQRIQIMISQIQPHFLFNTLSTIQALCRMNPDKAFETTEKFGTYLRQNIDSLGQATLIPFEKELEHTKIYAEIEMLRFPSIRLEYDIADSNFTIPALTVQPLVENAIRHGVRIRAQGLVSVTTRLENDHHIITIYDNGKGFDVSAAMRADGTHIGIRNVRERIKALCGGTLTISSQPGEGTTAVISIPCERETL